MKPGADDPERVLASSRRRQMLSLAERAPNEGFPGLSRIDDSPSGRCPPLLRRTTAGQ
jgi:hypothetical protein